jgi:hypothetical protein
MIETPAEAADFFRAVQLLRRMDPRHRHHCLYIASFYSDEQIASAERAGAIFGRP